MIAFSAAAPAPAPQVQMVGHDPIHGQQFYLDVDLRKALFEEYGVKSYRVYQRPGDGVFIPAGCAHQVRLLFLFWSSVIDRLFCCLFRLRTYPTASRSLLILLARRTSIDARS